MAIRQIRLYGDELLLKKSRHVDKIDDRILSILDDMAETMESVSGLGLAAVQVGVLRRLVVINVGEGLIRLINPVIINSEGEELCIEGCLSIPGYQGKVKRPEKVTVVYTDETGSEVTVEAQGVLRKALCHEIDHLDGILYSQIAETFYELTDEDDEGFDESEEADENGLTDEETKTDEDGPDSGD